VKSLLATLATIWRLAAPYYRSEDRWAGRLLLGAVVAIELSLVAIQVILNEWYDRFYNTCRTAISAPSSARDPVLLRDRGDLHRARGVPELSESVAADPLAALDDADLSAAMAEHREPLSHAAARRRRRQPRSAHRRRLAVIRAEHAVDRHRLAQCLRHARIVRRHFVEMCPTPRRCTCSACRSSFRAIWSLGGIDLCGDRAPASRTGLAGR